MKIFLAVPSLAVSIVLGLGAAAFAANPGEASDNNNASLTLELNVKEGCGISFEGGSNTIAFAPFNRLDAPQKQVGHFSLSCSAGYDKDVKIALTAGEVSSTDTVADRKLYFQGSTQSGKFLHFQVYQDENGKKTWGDSKDGADLYNIPASNSIAKENYPFMVELLAQSVDGLPEGSYSNILTASVIF